jgi:hypothetical protein
MKRTPSSSINNPSNPMLVRELQQKLEQHTGAEFSRDTAGFTREEALVISEATTRITGIILTRLTTLPVLNMDAEGLFQTAREFAGIDIGQSPASYIDNGYVLIKGSGILADLFGDHYGSTVNAISVTTKIKSSTVHTLMCLQASFIFHELGILVAEHQLTSQQLLAQLRAGYSLALKRLPEELFPFLEWIKPGATPVIEETDVKITATRTQKLTPSQRWIMTICLLLLAMMLVILLFRSRNSPPTPPVSGSAGDAVQVVGIRQEEIE